MKHINLWNLLAVFILAFILGVSCHPANASEIDWEAQAKAEWIIEHGENQVTLTEEAEQYLRKQTMIIQEFYDAKREKLHNTN
ncbi:TPA: hypothetical protein ACY36V_000308 [Pasteurella multocida]